MECDSRLSYPDRKDTPRTKNEKCSSSPFGATYMAFWGDGRVSFHCSHHARWLQERNGYRPKPDEVIPFTHDPQAANREI